jgi:hypothetical protein
MGLAMNQSVYATCVVERIMCTRAHCERVKVDSIVHMFHATRPRVKDIKI